MTDAFSGRALLRRPASRVLPGDRVQILAGQLAGLTGVVVRPCGRSNCTLVIEGLPDGVFFRICAKNMQRVGNCNNL